MSVDVAIAGSLVFAGALLGGLVNGLTGFGTGMTALPIWVQVLPPVLVSPLTIVCSVAGQLQTLPAIWHAIDVRRLLPFVAGGVLGVPVGVRLLPHVNAVDFKSGIGILLIVSCTVLLVHQSRAAWTKGGKVADSAVGLAGGILGGLAGLSGILPTLWAELRGWEKDARRGIFQGYNLSILAFAIANQGTAGLLTAALWPLLLIALPGTMVGVWLGRRIYGRLDTARFAKTVLVLLLASGVVLVATSMR